MKRAMNRQEYEAITIPHLASDGVKPNPNVLKSSKHLFFFGCARAPLSFIRKISTSRRPDHRECGRDKVFGQNRAVDTSRSHLDFVVVLQSQVHETAFEDAHVQNGCIFTVLSHASSVSYLG
jgi:hypothetical protein